MVHGLNACILSPGVRFSQNLSTLLNWVGCQQVTQQVHLEIHTMPLNLLFDDSILSKLLMKHPIIAFCIFAVSDIDYFGIHVFHSICCIFAYQGGQYFRYELKSLCNTLITQYAWPKVVDAPLTQIFMMGYCLWHVLYWLTRPQLLCIYMIATKRYLDYPR